MQLNNIMKLLDLPDIIATDLIQHENLYVFIAEHRKKSAVCPDCGAHSNKIHDSRWQNIKDIPIRNKEVIIRLKKNRYRCLKCGKRGFSQEYKSIEDYARKTKRYDKYLVNEATNRDYSNVSRENNLSYTSIKNAVKNHVDPIIQKRIRENISNLETISIDEFAVVKHHKYAVVISDPVNKEIVDILDSRKKEYLIKYFMSWTKEQRAKVKIFSMDMWSPYKSVAKTVFPNAKIVVDKFHLVAKMNKALDEIRKKVQNEVGDISRKKFYMSRKLLKKRGEDLKEKDHQKLIKLFKISPALEKAWELKEEFRDLLQMNDVNDAKNALQCWYQRVSDYKLTPFYNAKKTVKRWEQKIINYFKTGITNGFAEGINNKIKLIKRIGYGVPNIHNLKRRVFMSVV